MAEVPASGTKACSKENESIAGQPVVAEFPYLSENVSLSRKRAMRLHVAQRPLRGHHRRTGESNELAHRIRRSERINYKHIGRAASLARLPSEYAAFPAQVKTAARSAHKHRPAFCADEEGREASRPEFGQFVTLAVD